MNETGIIWTESTWNPTTGCEVVTEGCKFCYAETLASKNAGSKAFPNGFDLTYRPHKLRDPFKLKEPTLIFVNSMSDLFWEKIDDAYRDKVLDTIEATPQHQYQVLTKRPEEMLRYSKRRKLPPNFWAGVTIENQRNIGRVDLLREVEAEIRFISAEPLIGRLDFSLDDDGEPLNPDGAAEALADIHWLISGGESGQHLMDPDVCARRGLVVRVDGAKGVVWKPTAVGVEWITLLRDQCREADVAFFHKQWGGVRSFSGGRELEGRTWDEFPRYPEGGAWTKRHEHGQPVRRGGSLPLFEK